MSVETDIRLAIKAHLAADPAVRAKLGDPLRLFDQRNRRAAWPHASWGRSETRTSLLDAVDLVEMRLSIDLWCRDDDPVALTACVREALTRPVAASPPILSLAPVYSDVFETRDPRLRRGLVRVRVLAGRALDTQEGGMP